MSRADFVTIQDGRIKRIRLAKMRFQGASMSSHSSAQIFATVAALIELLSPAAARYMRSRVVVTKYDIDPTFFHTRLDLSHPT